MMRHLTIDHTSGSSFLVNFTNVMCRTDQTAVSDCGVELGKFDSFLPLPSVWTSASPPTWLPSWWMVIILGVKGVFKNLHTVAAIYVGDSEYNSTGLFATNIKHRYFRQFVCLNLLLTDRLEAGCLSSISTFYLVHLNPASSRVKLLTSRHPSDPVTV